MSKIEEYLYAAYEQGKRDVLLKKAHEIRRAPQHKHTSQGDLYEIAFQELVKEGIISAISYE